ncbi:MAG: PEP-utilizing enzyme [Candidatus Falkowbacteria bacterium]|nr:hypothetical protein [Patescibacteria group bacterium]
MYCQRTKIPCIVGTKIATQVLKNGDLVEVDAEKGVVKILEKNKRIKFVTRNYDIFS